MATRQRELIDEKFKEKWGNCSVCGGTDGLKHQYLNGTRVMVCDDCRHGLGQFERMSDREISGYNRICKMGISVLSSDDDRRLNETHEQLTRHIITTRARERVR